MKNLISIIILSMVCATVFAKGGSFGGGRSSGFGSRSYSSSARSISSTSTKASSSPSVASTVKAPVKTTLYQRFKSSNVSIAPPKSVVATDLNKIFDKKYRSERKSNFYSGYSTPHYVQPVYMQNSNYGMWDAMLMWSLLDNMGDRQMYYHHQDDPSFQKWRSDAQTLCSQGNQEVCTKLADLDKEVAQLKANGVKKDSTYITDGIDPNIYIAQGVNIDSLSEIKLCTGTQSSDYTRFAHEISDATKLKVRPILSNGSIDNLYKLSTGECDMAFAQSDTLVTSELITVFELSAKENAMLLCNNESKVQSLSDLTSEHVVYIGSDQTGSRYTYNSLKSNNVLNLDKPKLVTDKPTIQASLLVNDQPNACLFAVDTWDAPYIAQMDSFNKTKMIPMKFILPMYTTTRMDRYNYKNLIQSQFNGWWDWGTTTVAVQPRLVTTSTWAQQNPIILYDILMLNKQTLIKGLK